MPQDFGGRIPLPTLDPSAGEKINLKLRIVAKRGDGQRVQSFNRPFKPQLKLDGETFKESFLPSLKPKPPGKGLIVTSHTPSPCPRATPFPHPPGMHIRGRGMDDASSCAPYNPVLRQGSARGNPKIEPRNLPSIPDAPNIAGTSSFKARRERLKSSKHRGGRAKEKKAKQTGRATKLPDITKGQRPTAPKTDAWAPVSEQYGGLPKLQNESLLDGTVNNSTQAIIQVTELPTTLRGADTILPLHLVPLTFSEETIPDIPGKVHHQERHSGRRFHARSPVSQPMWSRKRFHDQMQ